MRRGESASGIAILCHQKRPFVSTKMARCIDSSYAFLAPCRVQRLQPCDVRDIAGDNRRERIEMTNRYGGERCVEGLLRGKYASGDAYEETACDAAC